MRATPHRRIFPAARSLLAVLALVLAAPFPCVAQSAHAVFDKAHEDFTAGNRDAALAGARRAVALARRENDASTEAYALDLIGNVHFDRFRPDLAIGYFEQAVVGARKVGDRYLEANALKDVGITYRLLGRHDEGIARLYESLEIFRDIHDDLGAFSALGNIGQAYTVIGAYRFAIDAFNESIPLLSTTDDPKVSAFNLEIRLGYFSLERDNPAAAYDHFENARVVSTQIHLPEHIRNWLSIGYSTALLKLGRTDEAIEMRRQSVEQSRLREVPVSYAGNLQGFASFFVDSDPDRALDYLLKAAAILEREKAADLLWRVSYDLGALRAKRGELDLAVDALSRAADDLDATRGRLLSETHRTAFYEKYQYVYRDLVDALLRRAERDARPEDASRAFAMLERGRSRATREAIAEARVDFSGDVSPELDQRRHQLGARIADLHEQIAQAESPEERTRVGEALTRAEEEFDSLAAEIKGDDPRTAAMRFPDSLTVDETQALLDDQTALLAYTLTDARATCFVVTRDAFSTVTLPVSGDVLAARVANYADLISHEEDTGWLPIGRRLDADLIEPIRLLLGDHVHRLVIAPDGILFYLPFETLPTDDGARPRYLLEDYTISYTPSATVLGELRAPAPTQRTAASVLVLADPIESPDSDNRSQSTERVLRALYNDEHLTVTPLPATRAEAEAIARYVPTASKVVTGREASERWLKSTDVGRYSVMHFATHGLVSARAPSRSALVLSHAPGDGEDGFLQAREIYQMRLSCDLVVLSACQTARGESTPGDGVQGLAQAFLHAGARSVVASLWNVNDERTATFMAAFYRHLAEHGSRAEALRAAKLDLLAQSSTAAPRFWAPFVLIGEDVGPVQIGPPDAPMRWSITASLGCAGLLLVLVFGAIFGRRRAQAPGAANRRLASPANLG